VLCCVVLCCVVLCWVPFGFRLGCVWVAFGLRCVALWYFDNVACSARSECSVFSYVSQVASVYKIQFMVTVTVV